MGESKVMKQKRNQATWQRSQRRQGFGPNKHHHYFAPNRTCQAQVNRFVYNQSSRQHYGRRSSVHSQDEQHCWASSKQPTLLLKSMQPLPKVHMKQGHSQAVLHTRNRSHEKWGGFHRGWISCEGITFDSSKFAATNRFRAPPSPLALPMPKDEWITEAKNRLCET